MKTKILFLAAILLATFQLQARTPRVSNKSFTYQTIKLPQLALPEDRTYTMSLETAADYGNLAYRYQSAIQIPGWTRADNGSYAVEVKLFGVDYQRPFIVSRSQLIKDTAGKIIDTIWLYKNVYKAVASGSLEIYNETDQTIYSNNLSPICLESSGQEFKSQRQARQHSRQEADRMNRDFVQTFLQGLTTQATKNLDVLLGIYPIRKTASMMIVRNKKHNEYTLMNNFWKRFQAVTNNVNANSDLAAIESKLFNEIEYLKNIENKYQGTKKADRKMRYMAYRNLSTLYEMLELPTEAIFYAQKIRNNDFRKFNANYVIADAQRMQRLQEIHGS